MHSTGESCVTKKTYFLKFYQVQCNTTCTCTNTYTVHVCMYVYYTYIHIYSTYVCTCTHAYSYNQNIVCTRVLYAHAGIKWQQTSTHLCRHGHHCTIPQPTGVFPHLWKTSCASYPMLHFLVLPVLNNHTTWIRTCIYIVYTCIYSTHQIQGIRLV